MTLLLSSFIHLSAIVVTIRATADPCVGYDTIDAWERSVANTIGTRCDSLLPEGWYRITSKAGELMQTECIHGGSRCGTGYTIWLNGTYPDYGETVNVTACASDLDDIDCCYKSYDIEIKNCSSFYVYKLLPVEGCPQAYCFGSELPCPDSLTSETGFTPGCYFEPCNNYQTIDSWERSVANTIGTSCDSLLPAGWYRITSKAGELMPTECIHGGARCGTGYTIWLNGSYPGEWETVNVTACASDLNDDNCCYKSYDIQIRNCNGSTFYVYNLVPVDGCPQGYCFGSELPCPDGQTSDTGYTPGCYLDPCQNYNTLSGGEKRSSSYILEDDSPIDDSNLSDGWYRFDSYVGSDIVDSSPSLNRCGTVYPVWLNGHIPSEVHITVNRTCCMTGQNSSCESTVEIQIRNCEEFRVYNLAQLSKSQSAYCFGTGTVTTTTASIQAEERTNIGIVAGISVAVVCIIAVFVVISAKCIRKNTKHHPSVGCSTSVSTNPPPYEDVIDKNTNIVSEKKE